MTVEITERAATTDRSLVAPASLVGCAVLWGSMVPFTHQLVQGYDPVFISMLRYVFGVAAILVMVLLLERGRLMPPGLPWGRIVRLGTFGIAGFAVCFSFGFTFADPVTAAVLMSAGPVIYAILARILYRAPLERGLGLAIPLVVAGGIAVVLGRPQGAALSFRGGELLYLVASTLWAWYSMRAQEWLGPYRLGQLRLSALTAMVGGVALVGVFLLVKALGQTYGATTMTAPADWAKVAWIGVTGAAFSVVLWNIGVSRIGAPVASLYGNLSGVFGVLFAAALGADWTWVQVMGGLLVLGGVVQMQARRLKRQ